MATPLGATKQQCIPFNPFSPNHGKVGKDKIKTVIADKLIPLFEEDGISFENTAELRHRVTRKLFGRRSYIINHMNQTPEDDEIFKWFISGKHGPKLHRKSIVEYDRELETVLRKAGVNPNHPCEKTGDTPLILAARIHDAVTVKALLGSGASVSLKNLQKHDAIYEIVKSMNGDNYTSTPLFETVKLLINSGANVRQKLDHSLEAISTRAVIEAQLCTAKLFINAPDHGIQHHAPLVLAKRKRRDDAKILELIYKKAPPENEPRNHRGMTPLMIASRYNNPKCLEVILKHPGTNIEALTVRQIEGFDKNYTAYGFSAIGGKCAEILEAHGAKKIRPELTDIEQQWLNDLRNAENARNISLGFGALAALSGVAPFAIIGGLMTGAKQAELENIRKSRPASQLDTPAKD